LIPYFGKFFATGHGALKQATVREVLIPTVHKIRPHGAVKDLFQRMFMYIQAIQAMGLQELPYLITSRMIMQSIATGQDIGIIKARVIQIVIEEVAGQDQAFGIDNHFVAHGRITCDGCGVPVTAKITILCP
jgi:hypothetical protein